MNGSFTTNDGVALSYTTYGAGDPVVFVHGWMLDSRLWEPIAAHLPGHLRVAYDHRGHGASADAPAGWHLHRLAFDLHELLDHLDLHDVTLVGHSMGCAVTWPTTSCSAPRGCGSWCSSIRLRPSATIPRRTRRPAPAPVR